MLVQHNGRESLLDLTDDFDRCLLIFGEKLRVVVQKEGGIEQGRHKVELTLKTRRTYTPTMVSTCEKILTFAKWRLN